MINGGIYLVNRTILEDYPKDKFSFENEILETKTAEIEMAAVESEGYFIDIGIPEDYAAAQKTMKERASVNKAAFFDRDGTINVDIHYLHRPEDLQFI